MTVQFSVAIRNARLDTIETSIGTGAKVEIRTGSPPATCAAASTGTLLVSYTLASDWMASASSGTKAFSSTPISGTASNNGTAGYYRVLDNAGTTCHMQGTVGTSGADMTIDNTSISNGQAINITSWSLTDGNA